MSAIKKGIDVIPNWLFKRYVYIWIRFKEKSFNSSDVKKEFKKTTNISLKELVDAGWINSKKELNSFVFTARPPQDIFERIYLSSFVFCEKE